MVQGLDSPTSRISTLYFSVGWQGYESNFYVIRLILKFSEKSSCCDVGDWNAFRVKQSAVQLRHWSGCDAVCFEVLILIVLMSTVSPQFCLEVFCQKFPLTAEVSFTLTSKSKITIIAKVLWCFLTVSRDTSEQTRRVRFDGSSFVVLWRIVLYCVDVWCVQD